MAADDVQSTWKQSKSWLGIPVGLALGLLGCLRLLGACAPWAFVTLCDLDDDIAACWVAGLGFVAGGFGRMGRFLGGPAEMILADRSLMEAWS